MSEMRCLSLAGCGKTIEARWEFNGPRACGNEKMPLRMLKRAVQQGRSKRSGESYFVPYVEPLSEARTKLANLFSILLGLL